MNGILGVDISMYQEGIDFTRLMADGAKFAILRGGDGDYKDKCFDGFYEAAKAVNLPVGAYWFSRATTEEEARAEATDFYTRCLKGRQFELPIYMDVEAEKLKRLGKTALNKVIQAWCDTMRGFGMLPGIYTNTNWLNNYLDFSKLHDIELWHAQWSTVEPTSDHGMWQFGGETNFLRSNTMAGKIVDQNLMSKDYPKIIKEAGLNGYKKEALPVETKIETRYHKLEDLPAWAQPEIKELMDAGALKGDENGDLDLSLDMVRVLIVALRYNKTMQ